MSTPQSVRSWGWFEGLPLRTEDVDGTDEILTLRGYVMRPRCLEYARGHIPAGTHSDGESNRRWLWSLMGHPHRGPVKPCAVGHDLLYATHGLDLLDERDNVRMRIQVDRRLADQIYYEMLRARGMTWLRARARYYGLRWFGARYW